MTSKQLTWVEEPDNTIKFFMGNVEVKQPAWLQTPVKVPYKSSARVVTAIAVGLKKEFNIFRDYPLTTDDLNGFIPNETVSTPAYLKIMQLE